MKSVLLYGFENGELIEGHSISFRRLLYAQNPLYSLAREDKLQRSVEGSKPGTRDHKDPEKKVELEWPHPREAFQQHHQAGCDLQSTGEEKEGQTQGWIGYTPRKPSSNITRQAVICNTQGKRRRGRPRVGLATPPGSLQATSPGRL